MQKLDLEGRSILVVEDDYLIAADVAEQVVASGGRVMGPAASVSAAMQLLQAEQPPDAAILDIKLGKAEVYPIADWLMKRGIPLAFASSYGRSIIPERFACVPLFSKPFNVGAMAFILCPS